MDFWKSFKQESNKVFSELLSSKKEVSFEDEKHTIQKIDNELISDKKYLLVEVQLIQGNKEGSFAFLIEADITKNVEFYMLQGFQQLDELSPEITPSSIDACKEFIQNITDNLASFLATNDIGIFEFEIKNIQTIDDIKSHSFEDFLFFNSFIFEGESFEHFSENKFFLLYGPFTSNIFDPKKEVISSTSSENNSEDNNEQDEAIVVSISDCLNQKKLYLEEIQNIKMLLNIELKLMIVLGTKKVLLRDVVNFQPGSLIELEQKVDTPLDIWINNSKIGEGEVVVIESNFGIQITKISSVVERLSKIKYKAVE